GPGRFTPIDRGRLLFVVIRYRRAPPGGSRRGVPTNTRMTHGRQRRRTAAVPRADLCSGSRPGDLGRSMSSASPRKLRQAPQRSHHPCTTGAPRVRAIGNVCPLGMNGVYALVIGGTDERLQRFPEVYRMLLTYVQIEGSPRVVAFDQLEMVGY